MNFKIKENIQEKGSVNKELLPETPQDKCVKTMQKQCKTKHKYNKEQVRSINPVRKTAQLRPNITKLQKKYIYQTLKAYEEKRL